MGILNSIRMKINNSMLEVKTPAFGGVKELLAVSGIETDRRQ